jgi:hypothetical protein
MWKVISRAFVKLGNTRTNLRKYATNKGKQGEGSKEEGKKADSLFARLQRLVTIATSTGYGLLNVYYVFDQYREVPRVVKAIEKGSQESIAHEAKVLRENETIPRPDDVQSALDLIQVGSKHGSLIGTLIGFPGSGKSNIINEAILKTDCRRIVVVRFSEAATVGEKGIVEQIATGVNYTPFMPEVAKSNFGYWLQKISFAHKRREPSLTEMFNVLANVCEMQTRKDKSKRILFIFDNIESFAKKDSTKELTSLLGFAKRGVVQDSWSVILVTDFGKSSQVIYEDASAVSSNSLWVGDVPDYKVKPYIIDRLIEKNKSIVTPDQVDRLVDQVTGGHAATIQRVISDVNFLHTNEQVDQFIEREIESARSMFGEYGYDRADIDYRSRALWCVLKIMVQNEGEIARDFAWHTVMSALAGNKDFAQIDIDVQLKLQEKADQMLQIMCDRKILQLSNFDTRYTFRTRKAWTFAKRMFAKTTS